MSTATPTTASTEPASPLAEAETPDNDALAPLAEGALACGDCGVAVASWEQHPERRHSLRTELAASAPYKGSAAQGQRLTVEFSQCTACAAATAAADDALGDAAVPASVHHLSRSATLGLLALGSTLPPTLDHRALALLRKHLGAPGAAARWSAAFMPLTDPARPSRAAVRPWAHLTPEQREALRQAHASWLATRAARASGAEQRLPTPPAPDPLMSGCIFCGVGAVIMPTEQVQALGGTRNAALTVWRQLVIATPSVIGAPVSPEPIRGWLCPNCSAAVSEAGVVGQASMEYALREHLRSTGRDEALKALSHGPEEQLSGLISWAAIVLRQRRRGFLVGPNATPWSHVELGGE